VPRVDSVKIDLILIYKRFRELYSQFDITLLPWHFVIEFIKDRYYVFNTRPIDMFFPVDNKQVQNRQVADIHYRMLTHKQYPNRG
jgi:hypothetical protein